MTRSRDSDSHLAAVADYVEKNGNQFAEVLERSEWDCYDIVDEEVVCFRLKDKSQRPYKGVTVAIDVDELSLIDPKTLRSLLGDVFLAYLEQGLPEREPFRAYFRHNL